MRHYIAGAGQLFTGGRPAWPAGNNWGKIRMRLSALVRLTALSLALTGGAATASEEDIYSIRFSEDGKYLITGGSGGFTLADNQKHTGGVKIWNSQTGTLVETLGQRSDLDTIFGNQYGRVGDRRWGISNFKDVVLTGDYPDGRILVIPSSLGLMGQAPEAGLPSFIGGHLDVAGQQPSRIDITGITENEGDCDPKSGFQDYVGPIVTSHNGHFAAIVVNTCHASVTKDDQQVGFEFRSDLHVMNLDTFEITHSVDRIDAGVYALGITENGKRAAFVGRDRFAVIDLDNGKQHVVERYPESEFVIPRQFSTLRFSRDGEKLVSLRNIYDIESGYEEDLKWSANGAKKPRRISSVSVAPDLSYFALVLPKRSLIMFGDDGLPQSYGKADKVVLMDTRSGERRDLDVDGSMTEGKRCVTDISPDSERVAVGCKGGLLRVYHARSGELIWKKTNVGKKEDNGLMQVRHNATDELFALLDADNGY